jgi:alkanal monooxygenase alpha chain
VAVTIIQNGMKWGVFLVSAQFPGTDQRTILADSVEYARTAERLGYDAAWVLEHHFTRYGLVGSPLTHAAYILGQTTRLKVGTAINVIPLEHPVRLAEEVALLDQLSSGRLYFGIGRGYFTKDFKVFGVDMGKSREIMSEWFEIMKEAWTTGRCTGRGPHARFDEVEVFPEPFTRPHPPVYVVAQSPSTVEWAAERGLPMIVSYNLEDDAKAAQLELYAEVAESAGFDPDAIDHALSCIAGVGKDAESIKRASTEYVTWWLDEATRASKLFAPESDGIRGYDWHRRQWETMAMSNQISPEARMEKYFRLNPIGSAQECIDRLQTTIDRTGLRHIICGFESVPTREGVLESIHRFTEEVIPSIKLPTRRHGRRAA